MIYVCRLETRIDLIKQYVHYQQHIKDGLWVYSDSIESSSEQKSCLLSLEANMTKMIAILLLITISTTQVFGSPAFIPNPFTLLKKTLSDIAIYKGEVTKDVLKGFGAGIIFGKRSAENFNYPESALMAAARSIHANKPRR